MDRSSIREEPEEPEDSTLFDMEDDDTDDELLNAFIEQKKMTNQLLENQSDIMHKHKYIKQEHDEIIEQQGIASKNRAMIMKQNEEIKALLKHMQTEEAKVPALAAAAAVAAVGARASAPAALRTTAPPATVVPASSDEDAFLCFMPGNAYRKKTRESDSDRRAFCPSWSDKMVGVFANCVVLVSRDLRCLLRDHEQDLKDVPSEAAHEAAHEAAYKNLYDEYNAISATFDGLLEFTVSGSTGSWFMTGMDPLRRRTLMVSMCNMMHNEVKLNPLLSVTNGSLQITAKNTRLESDFWKRACVGALFPWFECKLVE